MKVGLGHDANWNISTFHMSAHIMNLIVSTEARRVKLTVPIFFF